MFGMQILDVVIGLFFGYLVLSLAVTAANELGAAMFRRRAWMLRKGIGRLMASDDLVKEFYGHPLIRSLATGPRGPSYIPSRTFAIALLDVVAPRENGHRRLPTREEAKARGLVHQTLAVLAEEAGSADEFQKSVETWFTDSMDRVSGWYKRRTQVFLLLWAAVLTVGTNADTLVIARTLWRDTALREAVVASAQRYVADEARPAAPVPAAELAPAPAGDGAQIPPLPPDQQAELDVEVASARYDAAMADLAEMQLPIGWDDPTVPAAGGADPDAPSFRLVREDATDEWPGSIFTPEGRRRWIVALDAHLLGWLLTVLAISLGAPFWFDTLNRIIAIRSAGRAPEEAQRSPKVVPRPKEPGEE